MTNQTHNSSRVLVGIGALTLLALGGYSFLLVMILTKTHHVSQVAQELASEVAREQNLTALRSLLDGIVEERATLLSYVVDADDVVSFIQSLETVGDDARLSAFAVRQVTVKEMDAKNNLIAEIVTEGSWATTIQFLALLETMPLHFSITRMSLERTVDATGKNPVRWNGVLSIRAPLRNK